MQKYSSEEAIKRHEAGLTDRLDSQEFIRLCEEGEGDFMTIDLRGTDLRGIQVKEGSTLYGSNLSKVNLSRATLASCTLNEADLSGADLSEADLRHSFFSNTNLYQTNLSGANLTEAELSGTDLRETVLMSANLEKAKLDEANLTRVNLNGVNLDGANLKWANLTGANLDGANLNGADLGGTIMPDGLRNGTIIEAEAASVEEAKQKIRSQIPDGSMLISEKIVSDGQQVIRARQTIEIEARSPEEARSKARAQVSQEYELLSEKIISGAKPETIRSDADSTATAFEKALQSLPGGASILEKKEIASPKHTVIIVEAPDDSSARANAQIHAKKNLGSSASVENIILVKAGSKGLLGLGAKPNQYEVGVRAPAIVEIRYQPIIKLFCEFGIVDRPLAKVTARITTVKQELNLLEDAIITGSITGGPILLSGLRIAENILRQSPESNLNVVSPFLHSVPMLMVALEGMISDGNHALALPILDEFFNFISALKLVLPISVKNTSDFRIGWCAEILSGLDYRYSKIVELTNSLDVAEKSLVCSQECLKMVPDEDRFIRNASLAHVRLGIIYDRRHNTPQTIAHLQQAVEINPESEDGWWLLSKVYMREGEMMESINCCGRAAELGHPKAIAVLAQINNSGRGR